NATLSNLPCGYYHVNNTNVNYPKPFLSYYSLVDAPPVGSFIKTEGKNNFNIVLPRVLYSKGYTDSLSKNNVNPEPVGFGVYDAQFVFQTNAMQSRGLMVAGSSRYFAQSFLLSSSLNTCAVGIGIMSPNISES